MSTQYGLALPGGPIPLYVKDLKKAVAWNGITPGAEGFTTNIEHACRWSNTGYLLREFNKVCRDLEEHNPHKFRIFEFVEVVEAKFL